MMSAIVIEFRLPLTRRNVIRRKVTWALPIRNLTFFSMEMLITGPAYFAESHTMSATKPYTAGHEFIQVDCHKPLAY